MKSILALISVPLMLLNMLGGIVSGIWLGILGQWWAIGLGLAGLVLSSFLISLLLLPSLALFGPGMALLSRGRTIAAMPFLFLNTIYTYGIIAAWCMFVFFTFTRSATDSNFLPLLIWSYGAATGPWAYMAAREQQGGSSEASSIAIFFAQIAYIVVGVTALVSTPSHEELTELFSAVMGVAMLFQFVLLIVSVKEARRFEQNGF